ncbi:MAG: Mbov_0396 family ICE element transmembrane protein [Christensenellaceae bacterium]
MRDIFGDYNAALFGIWPTSWKCNGMVDPNKFLYFPSLVASIALGIAMIVAIVNLAKRVFEIVFLYLVMPLSMSTLAADDGARFKVWRETFITKIVLAYGAVFSVNIFVLILPLLSQMQIEGIGGFGNSLFLIFMIIGGAMVIPAGMGLFARLFGQGDDAHGGGSFLRSAYYGSRFASLAAFGLAGGILGRATEARAVSCGRSNKKSSAAAMVRTVRRQRKQFDGGDRYMETPAAAKNETDTEKTANRLNSKNCPFRKERANRGLSVVCFKEF